MLLRFKGYILPFLQLEKTKLNYETYGDSGEWITLINGHTRPLKDFKMFSKKLVESGFHVLIFDNRGSGETKTAENFIFKDFIDDVKALWDELEISSTHLVGVSMGGLISQSLVSKFPKNVKKLILISTMADYSPYSKDTEWGDTIESVKYTLSNFFSEHFLDKNDLLVSAMTKQIFTQIKNNNFSENAKAQKNAMSTLNYNDISLDSINNETLIIHGDEDKIIPFFEAETLNKKIKKSSLYKEEGKGHLLIAEMSQILYSKVINFIA